ncbi:Lrp/AsnC family transcriptional regulator [Nocardia sp. NPDC052566]|uniref:Lrp/AsnC family transcriptional regulator n=1 Tax=Nocardia sp. NPDC052566 TaxID=3364330 RepID=UPI0037CAEE1B
MTMLDEVDRGLIHALHIDGRAPFGRIAAVLGVSTQTVARRYRRLRAAAGLRVVGLADASRADRAQWLVRLTTTTAAARNLAQALARRSDTSWVKLTSGGTEIVFIVDVPLGADPSKSLLLHDIPRTAGVTGVSAHLVLHRYRGGPMAWHGHIDALDEAQYRELTRTRSDAIGRPATSAGDLLAGQRPGATARADAEAAGALLAALGRDGRATLADLAAATGWSQATVARRLAQLRASGELFFDVEFDDALFGVEIRALLWMSVAPARLDAVATALAGHRELAFVVATTGSTNLVAQAMCPNPAALHRYLTDRLGALTGIAALTTTPVLVTVKAAAPAAVATGSVPSARSTR